jgi:hypothetical protein
MAAMPQHDPVPGRHPPARPAVPRAAPPASRREEELERAARAWARYKTMMKWMVLVAALTVLAALAWLKSSGEAMPIHMVIATVAGVGFTVLVGTGLMGLVFLSNSSGHDDEAHRGGAPAERDARAGGSDRS